jgi:hypothetical protein
VTRCGCLHGLTRGPVVGAIVFLSVTRKRKILIAVVAVVASAITWAAWPGEEEGGITISYAGVSPNDTKRVVFTITNNSKNTFRYMEAWTTEKFQGSPDLFRLNPRASVLAGYSTTNCEREAFFPGRRWTLYAVYGEGGPEPMLYRIRISAGLFFNKRNWTGIGRRILPPSRLKFAYGPDMLGNQPVPLTQQ